MQDTIFSSKPMWEFSGKKLNFSTPMIMGILNVTPDSFFDGGSFDSEEKLIMQVEKMLTEGAQIIDIGGASSKPGANEIPIDEELKRVINTVKIVRKTWPKTLLSVDTYRSAVAQQAINAGADMINDISGGQLDSLMFKTVAELKAPYILMHMQGTPKQMQTAPEYTHVTSEVLTFFKEKLKALEQLGVKNIALDPGFGFGKSTEHNYELLKDLNAFTLLGYPVLAGLSRKSMINKVLHINPDEALNGTTVLNTIALLNGAMILRVHDVKEAREAIQLVSKLNDV